MLKENGITDEAEKLEIRASADAELRKPALKWLDYVTFGKFICDLRDANGDFYPVEDGPPENLGKYYKEGHYITDNAGCRSGLFKCRLPDDIPEGYYNISISNGRAQIDDLYDNFQQGRGDSMIAKIADSNAGGFAFSPTNGSYSLAVEPVVHEVIVTGDRTLTVTGNFLSSNMYTSIGDAAGDGVHPVNATCYVNENRTVLECELTPSETRSLIQIANASDGDTFLSARGGVRRERWAFETVKDSWYTYPWQNNWQFRWDPKAVIASFRAAGNAPANVDILADTWRTGPLFDGMSSNFARRFGLWYQTTFFVPPKTALYRFPIKYEAATHQEKPQAYIDGVFYSDSNLYGNRNDPRSAFGWKPMAEGSTHHVEIYGLKYHKGNGNLEVGMDMSFNLKDAPQLTPGSVNTLSQLITTSMGSDGGVTKWRVTFPDNVEGGAFLLKLADAADSTGWKSISLVDSENEMERKLTSIFEWNHCTENYDGDGHEWKWQGYHESDNVNVDNSFETKSKFGQVQLWQGGIRDTSTAACGRASLKVRGSHTTPGKGIGSAPRYYDWGELRPGRWMYPKAFSTGRYLAFNYKIPPGSQANLVLSFDKHDFNGAVINVMSGDGALSRCSVPMTWTAEPELLWDIPKCGDSGHVFVADDTWREAVIDIESMLTSGGWIGDEPKILYVEFASPMLPIIDKCMGSYGRGCDARPDHCGDENPEKRLPFMTTRNLDLIGDFHIDEIVLARSPRQQSRLENANVKGYLSEGHNAMVNLRVKKSEVTSNMPRQIDIEIQFAGGCGTSKASNISKPVELAANFEYLTGNKSAIIEVLTVSSSTALRNVEMRLFGPSTGGSNVNATLPIAGSVIDWKTAIDALHAGLDVEVRDYTHENESCHLSRIIEWGRTVILQSDNTTIADNLSFGNAAVSGSQWDSGVSVTIINEGVIENNLISDRDQSIIFLPSSTPSVLLRSPSRSMVRCSSGATADRSCDFDLANLTNITGFHGRRRRRNLLTPGSSESLDFESPRKHVSSRRIGFKTSAGKHSRQSYHELLGPPNILREDDLLGMKAVTPGLGGHSHGFGSFKKYGNLREEVKHNNILRRSLLSTNSSSASKVYNFSDPAAWNNTSPNWTNIEILYLPTGTTLYLDESIYIRFWVIEGTLIVSDTKNITMEAEAVIVHGEDGKFLVGTESEPFMHDFELLLHGSWQSQTLPKFGIKTLGMTDGEIVLHGKPVLPTWSLLNHTAEIGNSSIVVRDVTNWKAGDKIVIAGTGGIAGETSCRMDRDDQCQSEERFIISVVNHDGDGLCTVHLSEPLKHRHLGITHSSYGHSIEMRAEVLHLSRNVRVRGTSDIPNFGSHIMVLSGKVIWKYFETTYAGQTFQLGRYATHIHTVGQPSQKTNGGSDQSGSLIYGNAFHHSFNRGLTAHACHNLTVTRNVAYNVLGHQFFIEDGVETRNNYTENVGLMAHRSFSLLNTDQTPANFWITNPNNDFVRNRAVGSHGFGFWFDTFKHPTGPSADPSVWSTHAPLGTFEDNTAHSCGMDGFWIDRVDPREGEGPNGMRLTGKLTRCEAWLNGALGIGLVTETGHLHIIDAKVASNGDGGIGYIKNQADRWWSKSDTNAPVVLRPVFFGDGPYSRRAIGFGGAFSGYTSVVDAVFIGFGPQQPIAACLPTACKPFKGGHESRWYNTTFLGQTGPKVRWADTFADNFLYDADGTISDTSPNSSWIHNRAREEGASSSLGYFDPNACSLHSSTAGIVCDASQVSLRVFNVFDHRGLQGRRPISFMIKTKFGKAKVPFFHYNHMERRWNVQFTVLMTNKTASPPIVHEINVAVDVYNDPELHGWSGASHIREALADEWAVFRFPTVTLPDSISTKASGLRSRNIPVLGGGSKFHKQNFLLSQNSYNKTSDEKYEMEPWGGFSSTEHVAGDWVFIPNTNDADNPGNGGYFDMLLSGDTLPKLASPRGGAIPPSSNLNQPYSLECESARTGVGRGVGCFFHPDESIKMLPASYSHSRFSWRDSFRKHGSQGIWFNAPSRAKPELAHNCMAECNKYDSCRGILYEMRFRRGSKPWNGEVEGADKNWCYLIYGEFKGTIQDDPPVGVEAPIYGKTGWKYGFYYRRLYRRTSLVGNNFAGNVLDGRNASYPLCVAGKGFDRGSCDKASKMDYPLSRADCDPDFPERNCLGTSINCFGEGVVAPEASAEKIFSWCDTKADPNWKPPKDGEDAIIKRGWTVVLDKNCLATANLRWLDVYGTLKFVGSSAKPDLKLSAESIMIAAISGRIEAGTADGPFIDGTVTIELTGHRKGLARTATKLAQGALRKYMLVLGTLSLHGTSSRVATWLRLAEDAQAGATTVVVDASVGSSRFTDEPPSLDSMQQTFVGERVVISSSDRSWKGHEVVSVTAIAKLSSDEMDSHYRLTLSEPLLRAHLGPGDADSIRRGLPGTELGILGDKSTVRVIGADVYTSKDEILTGSVDVENFGAAIHVVRVKSFPGMSKEQKACVERKVQGQALISHVKFEHCGQRLTASCLNIRGEFNNVDSEDEGGFGAESYVHDSIFDTNYGTAIDFAGKGLTVKNNFVFNTTSDKGAIRISGHYIQLVSNNIAKVRDDAPIYFHDIGSSGIIYFEGAYTGGMLASYPESKFLNNAVSGVQYTGIRSNGIGCDSHTDPEIRQRYGNNVVHSVDFQGVYMNPTNLRQHRTWSARSDPQKYPGKRDPVCGAHVGYTVYSVPGYGMLTYSMPHTVFVSENKFHDVNLGVTGWFSAGSAFKHECISDIHLKVRSCLLCINHHEILFNFRCFFILFFLPFCLKPS